MEKKKRFVRFPDMSEKTLHTGFNNQIHETSRIVQLNHIEPDLHTIKNHDHSRCEAHTLDQ